MKILLNIFFIAGLAGYAFTVQSAEPTELPQSKLPSGRILQYGVYTLLRGGEIMNSSKTSTGKSVSKPVITRDRQTDRIPLIRDKYMAYQYRLSNLPDTRFAKLRRVLIHPSFTLPDGSVTTGSDYTITQKVDRNEVFAFDAYALNEDYEMIEGEWVFQIWFQDKMLVEQRFITYRPEQES